MRQFWLFPVLPYHKQSWHKQPCTYVLVKGILQVMFLGMEMLDMSVLPIYIPINEVRWGEVTQSCPTLCDPMDCSLPGSSVHGILQARILEWVAISFSRGSSRPRDRTQFPSIVWENSCCSTFYWHLVFSDFKNVCQLGGCEMLM